MQSKCIERCIVNVNLTCKGQSAIETPFTHASTLTHTQIHSCSRHWGGCSYFCCCLSLVAISFYRHSFFFFLSVLHMFSVILTLAIVCLSAMSRPLINAPLSSQFVFFFRAVCECVCVYCIFVNG